MEFLTNPYSLYGAVYKAIYVGSYNWESIYTPRWKKLKGYQKRK